ncbi:hypothetical protein IAU59_002662 [Kwoniella sp. CBS 9459]
MRTPSPTGTSSSTPRLTASSPPTPTWKDEDEGVEVIDCTVPSLYQSRSLSALPSRDILGGSSGLKRSASLLDIPLESFLGDGSNPPSSPYVSQPVPVSRPDGPRRKIDAFPLTDADRQQSRGIEEMMHAVRQGKKALEKREAGRKVRRLWTVLRGGQVWDHSKGGWVSANTTGRREGGSDDGQSEDVEVRIQQQRPTVIDVDQMYDGVNEEYNDSELTSDEKGEEEDFSEEDDFEEDDVIKRRGTTSSRSPARSEQRSASNPLSSASNHRSTSPLPTERHHSPASPLTPGCDLIITPSASAILPFALSLPVSPTIQPTVLSFHPDRSSKLPFDTSKAMVDYRDDNNQLPTPSPSPVKQNHTPDVTRQDERCKDSGGPGNARNYVFGDWSPSLGG